VHLLADGVVLLAEADQLRQLVFHAAGLLAQGEDLPFGDGNGAAPVGMRHVQVRQQVVVVLEELGIGLQVARDVVGCDQWGLPVNAVSR